MPDTGCPAGQISSTTLNNFRPNISDQICMYRKNTCKSMLSQNSASGRTYYGNGFKGTPKFAFSEQQRSCMALYVCGEEGLTSHILRSADPNMEPGCHHYQIITLLNHF